MRYLVSAIVLMLTTSAWGFPINIEHKFGTTEIPAKPLRVVSVGYSEQDDLLALGVKPVAVRDWYGDFPFAVWPWAQDELGDAEPVVMTRDGYDYETIAELNPDIIIGLYSGMSRREYQRLSRIAPTIAQPGEYIDYGTPWDEKHIIIGRALGYEDLAIENVAKVEARFDSLRQQHPEFENKVATVAYYYSGEPGAYSEGDLRSLFLQKLGFQLSPEITELAGDSFYASFSEERLDLLDNDLLIWLSAGDALQDVEGIALRKQMNFYKEGREVFAGGLLGGAFSFFSPLSLDYLLDTLIPDMVTAIDGDPETQVSTYQ